MSKPMRTTTTTTTADDAIAIVRAERAKRAAAADVASRTPLPHATPIAHVVGVRERARLAAGGSERKPIAADEKARRDRCKRSRSVRREYVSMLALASDATADADVRAYAAARVEALAERYNAAEEQLAAELKR